MTNLEKARALQAQSVIKALEKRNMTAYYCESKEDCLKKVLELVPEKSTIAWGGSESIKECNIPMTLKNGNYTVYDRADYNTPEKTKEFNVLAFTSDYYFMSSNAITTSGELVNIDGNGNRVAALIYGPENVIIIAGMNKIVKDVEEGISRTRNTASPQNCIRLKKNTPCAVNGVCGNCLADTICDQIVITRASRVPQRIKVILVGEELGF